MASYWALVIAAGDCVRACVPDATVPWNEDESEVYAVIRLSPAVGPCIHLVPAAKQPRPWSANFAPHKSQSACSQLSFPPRHWEVQLSLAEPCFKQTWVAHSLAWPLFTHPIVVFFSFREASNQDGFLANNLMILSSGESLGLSWLDFLQEHSAGLYQRCSWFLHGWPWWPKESPLAIVVQTVWLISNSANMVWKFPVAPYFLCMSFKFLTTGEYVRQLSDMLFNMLFGRNLDIYLSRAAGAGKRHLLPCLSTLALTLQMNTPSLQPLFSCHEPWASTEIYSGFLSINQLLSIWQRTGCRNV